MQTASTAFYNKLTNKIFFYVILHVKDLLLSIFFSYSNALYIPVSIISRSVGIDFMASRLASVFKELKQNKNKLFSDMRKRKCIPVYSKAKRNLVFKVGLKIHPHVQLQLSQMVSITIA